MFYGCKRHLQSGWQSLSQPRCWGTSVTVTRCPCHACQLLSKQTGPYTTGRAQHYEIPGLSPLPAQLPTSGGRARPSSWDGTREDGAGVWAWHQRWGPRAPCTALAGPAGSSAGRARRKHRRTCCTRPGMLREPHACLTQVLPAPLSHHRSPAPLQLRPFSLGLQMARGGCAPTLGSIPQERGMGQSIQPFLPWEGRDHTNRAISKQFGHLQTGL